MSVRRDRPYEASAGGPGPARVASRSRSRSRRGDRRAGACRSVGWVLAGDVSMGDASPSS
eukprot:6980787-Pyramimonas_sp.AAC.1